MIKNVVRKWEKKSTRNYVIVSIIDQSQTEKLIGSKDVIKKGIISHLPKYKASSFDLISV